MPDRPQNPSPEQPHGTTPVFSCLVCDVELEPGFCVDMGEGTRVARWAPGVPERGWLIGEVCMKQVKQALPMMAHRCPSCGRLEFYVLPPPERT